MPVPVFIRHRYALLFEEVFLFHEMVHALRFSTAHMTDEDRQHLLRLGISTHENLVQSRASDIMRGTTGWKSNPSKCDQCGASLYIMNRHHCRSCGDVVCNRCTVEAMGIKFCKFCNPR